MPLASIPFKSPPAFDLPPMMAEPLRTAPRSEAAQAAIDLLTQVDAGEALAVVFVDSQGTLTPGAAHGSTPQCQQALEAWHRESPAAITPHDLFGKVILEGQPLLWMGDLRAEDDTPLSPSFKEHLLGGAPQAPLGFLYAYPLPGRFEKPVGALIIHRPLAAGPLNHDQPAIAQAVAQLLGEAASA